MLKGKIFYLQFITLLEYLVSINPDYIAPETDVLTTGNVVEVFNKSLTCHLGGYLLGLFTAAEKSDSVKSILHIGFFFSMTN